MTIETVSDAILVEQGRRLDSGPLPIIHDCDCMEQVWIQQCHHLAEPTADMKCSICKKPFIRGEL